MNNRFCFSRFKMLEKYHAKESLLFCLLLCAILSGVYLIAYYLNQAENMETAPFIKRIGLLVYMLAPCLFERPLNSYNSTLEFLLPCSTEEKYLHLWLKYCLVTPGVLILSALFLFTVTGLFQGGDLFMRDILGTFALDHSFLWMTTVFQPVFFTGYFLFKKRVLLKSLASTIALFLTTALLIGLLEYMVPAKVEINNALANPIYNFPVSATYRFLIHLSTFFPVCFVVGMWIVSYRLLKEKEI